MIRYRPMRPLVTGPLFSFTLTLFGIFLMLLFVLLYPTALR